MQCRAIIAVAKCPLFDPHKQSTPHYSAQYSDPLTTVPSQLGHNLIMMFTGNRPHVADMYCATIRKLARKLA